MTKRYVVVIAMLLALALPLASAASADEISGSGTIWVKGAGLTILRGTGGIQIEGHGMGLVWVKGAEHLQATGEGHRWEIPETGATVFWGWSGSISASGHQMNVWMTGGSIEFTASGTGKVYLRGRGTYALNGHEGAWSSAGDTLPLNDSSTESQ